MKRYIRSSEDELFDYNEAVEYIEEKWRLC